MPFTIVQQDITTMKIDAIVNAANEGLRMGGGVCGAIFNAAGAKQIQAACDELAPIKTGEAVITPGFNLTAKYVIHAVGPIYHKGNTAQNAQLLRSAYLNSLERAVENHCASVAFPLISSGIYGYPKEEAIKIAISAIQDFLNDHDLTVALVVYDEATFLLCQEIFGQVNDCLEQSQN